MALQTRQIELILLARDHSSATLARVGGAFVILGASVATAGKQILDEIASWTEAAIDFQQDIALAVTQAEIPTADIVSVGALVKRVGADAAIPWEDLTGSVFDIFSTLDIGNLGQVEGLLREFEKSAVAGQAPIEDIGRSTIAWLNALDLAPTAENANKILQIMFELVRKGAGSYSEFSGEVGKSIPAMVAANQSVETFAGGLAFLTRNGLDAAMGSTSLARAVELMFAPKGLKGLAALNIDTVDASGNFRQMNDILRDLRPHFEGLDDASRKILFKEIFGTGRIQARRFFDLAIPNFEEFDRLIGTMFGTQRTDELQKAYELMFDQPGSQIQNLSNNLDIIKKDIGSGFIPAVQKAIPQIMEWLGLWQDLSPETKLLVGRIIALVGAGLTLFGTIMTVVGALILIKALFAVFGISMVAVAGTALLFIAVIAAIAAIVWLVIANWTTLKEFFFATIDFLIEKWNQFFESNRATFEAWFERVKAIWDRIQEVIDIFFSWIQAWGEKLLQWAVGFWDRWGDTIFKLVNLAWEGIKDITSGALKFIQGLIDIFIGIITLDWDKFWNGLKTLMDGIWQAIVGLIEVALALVAALFIGAFEILRVIVMTAWDIIKNIFQETMTAIANIMSDLWGVITRAVMDVWNALEVAAGVIWDAIKWAIINPILSVLNKFKPLIELLKSIFILAWELLRLNAAIIWLQIKTFIIAPILAVIKLMRTHWGTIKGILLGAWNTIRAVAKTIWIGVRKFIINPMLTVISKMKQFWEFGTGSVKTILLGAWNFLRDSAKEAWEQIKNWIVDPLVTTFKAVKKFTDDVLAAFNWLIGKITAPVNAVRDIISKLNPFSLFSPAIAPGVISGINRMLAGIYGPLDEAERRVGEQVGRIREQLRIQQDLQTRLAAAVLTTNNITIQQTTGTVEETTDALSRFLQWQ